MAKVDKRITGVKKRNLVEHGIPVQAYIPKEVFLRFKRKYPRRGSVSKLIRKAFLMAVEDGPNAGKQFADPNKNRKPSPPRDESTVAEEPRNPLQGGGVLHYPSPDGK